MGVLEELHCPKSGLKENGNVELNTSANLVVTIRFHLLRKWLMDTLDEAGLTGYQIDIILGKAIPSSKRTYLQGLKRRAFENYRKAYPLHLSLSQVVNGQAKYNELVDLAVQMFSVMDKFKQEAKSQGLMKMTTDLEEQWQTVKEFAKVMQKKNGKPKEKQGHERKRED